MQERRRKNNKTGEGEMLEENKLNKKIRCKVKKRTNENERKKKNKKRRTDSLYF